MGEISGGGQTPAEDDFVKNLTLIEGRLNGLGNRLHDHDFLFCWIYCERSVYLLPIRSQQYSTRLGTRSILDRFCTGDAAARLLPLKLK